MERKKEMSDYITVIRDAVNEIKNLLEYSQGVEIAESDAAEICEIIGGCIADYEFAAGKRGSFKAEEKCPSDT